MYVRSFLFVGFYDSDVFQQLFRVFHAYTFTKYYNYYVKEEVRT